MSIPVAVSASEPAAPASPLPSVIEDSFTPTRHRWREEPKDWLTAIPFIAIHLAPLAAIWTGVPWRDLVLCAALYFARMFFITAGYHRYFAHRSYRLARVPQFLMGLGGITAVQKGPLWWAGHHREHHRYGDTDRDPHSPLQGFWWSHVGWILSRRYKATNYEIITDFARYPELVFLNRFQLAGPLMLGAACWWFFGWAGLVVGFAWSTVLLWHGTFIVNSVTHLVGRRRYATPDTSRNSFLVALATNGEGWHNNHHHYPASARQGFYWWEWDPSYYGLWVLERIGVVTDLRRPPSAAVRSRRTRDGTFDIGMFRAFLCRATRLAMAVGARSGVRIESPTALGAGAAGAGAADAGAAGAGAAGAGAPGAGAVDAGAVDAGRPSELGAVPVSSTAAVRASAASGAAAASAAVAEAQRRLAEALAEVAARAKELTRASRAARDRA